MTSTDRKRKMEEFRARMATLKSELIQFASQIGKDRPLGITTEVDMYRCEEAASMLDKVSDHLRD